MVPTLLLTRLSRTLGASAVPLFYLLCVALPCALLLGAYCALAAPPSAADLLQKLQSPAGLIWCCVAAALAAAPLCGAARRAWRCSAGLLGAAASLLLAAGCFAVLLPALTMPYGGWLPLLVPPLVAAALIPALALLGVLWSGRVEPLEEDAAAAAEEGLAHGLARLERLRLLVLGGAAASAAVFCASLALLAFAARGCALLGSGARDAGGELAERLSFLRPPQVDARGFVSALRLQWRLWRQGDDSPPLPSPQEAGTDPLLLAAMRGDIPRLEEMLAGGADVNAEGFDSIHGTRQTPLRAAFEARQAEAMRLLIRQGAAFSAAGRPELHGSALVYAADRGDAALVARLLELGEPVDAPEPSTGWTPLMFALNSGHAEAAKRLLEFGADPARRAPDGTEARALAQEHPGLLPLLETPAKPLSLSK